MRKQKGFSLIELLIVVAIILIIAAIAIPNLLRSRMAANEASAVGSMRTLNTMEIQYSTSFPSIGFSAAAADLGDGGVQPCVPATTSACLIDSALSAAASGGTPKSGYNFVYTAIAAGGTNSAYTIVGDPSNRGTTGTAGFFTDESGVIRKNPTAAATVADAPIGQGN